MFGLRSRVTYANKHDGLIYANELCKSTDLFFSGYPRCFPEGRLAQFMPVISALGRSGGKTASFSGKKEGETEGRRAFRRVSIKVLAVVHARNKMVPI